MGGNSQSKQTNEPPKNSDTPTKSGPTVGQKKEKKEKLEEEDQWLYEYLLQYLTSPMWKIPIYDFLEENCIIFDDEEENKFEYTECHNKFKVMIESTFDQLMKEIGIDQEKLYQLILIGLQSKAHRQIFEQLLIVDNFAVFKKLMVKKNKELELEALQELQKTDKSGATKDAIKQKELEAEQAEIQHAIAISMASEKEKLRMQELEDQQLEKAIQMSQMEYDSMSDQLVEQTKVAEQSQQKLDLEQEESERIKLEMAVKEKLLKEQSEKDQETKRAIAKLAAQTEATNARLRQLEEENRAHKDKLAQMAEETEELRKKALEMPTPMPDAGVAPVVQKQKKPKTYEEEQKEPIKGELSNISNLPPLDKQPLAALPVIPNGRFDKPVEDLIKDQQNVEEQIDIYKKVAENLKNMKPPEKVVDDQPKEETLEERKQRLLAQREMLRKKKQVEREAELKEYKEAPQEDKQLKTQSSLALDETKPVSNISDQELKKRQNLMSKIKSDMNNN